MRALAALAFLFVSAPAFAEAGVCRGDASPCSSFSMSIMWDNCMKQQGCSLQSNDAPPYRTWCGGSARSCSSFGTDLDACGKQYGCYWFIRVEDAPSSSTPQSRTKAHIDPSDARGHTAT